MTAPNRSDLMLGVLLSAAAGSVDVLALTTLGGAFASVITGNVVVAGASIGVQNWSALSHAAVAVAAYAFGVAVGHAVLRFRIGALGVELALVLALSLVWIASNAHPSGASQYIGLTLAATAMGAQSAAFTRVRLPGVSTTYFTGTLTGLVSGLVTRRKVDRYAGAALCALLIGAIATGLAVAHAPLYSVLVPFFLVLAAFVSAANKR
ncbi:DUF1275 family protein [Actinomycetes bacterium M1A6_2h]